MNRLHLLISAVLVISLLLFSCGEGVQESTENFAFSPDKPVPGETVTLTYMPETQTSEIPDITMQAYLYSKDWPVLEEVSLQSKENKWEGEITPNPETRGILIQFTSGKIVDNNNRRGYWIPLYNKEGNMVPGAEAGLAEGYEFWGPSLMDLERDHKTALSKFQKEFSTHPELKSEFLGEYLQTLKNAAPENWKEQALNDLNEVSSRENLDEETLNPMVFWYRELGEEDRAEEIAVMLREKYPEGGFVEGEQFDEVYQEKDLDKKMELARKFQERFPESERLDTLHYLIVRDLIGQGKIQEMKAYFENHPGLVDSNVINLAASRLLEQDKYPDLALRLAEQGISAVREQLNRPEKEKPSYMTEEAWRERIEKYNMAPLLDTKGQLLLDQGEADKAADDLEKAVAYSQAERPDINRHYGEALIRAGRYEKALEQLSGFVQKGTAGPEIRGMLKTAYEEEKGSAEDFSAYLEELEEIARERIRAELKEEIMEEPAPDFILEDLGGNQVSLSGLSGKTLVIDFWATWCGPCISSFPAMKRAVKKFKDDSSVEFLFINSWQQEENKKENAQNFINKHDYPFHVLLDVNDEVITSFGVRGIPTKFVVDKNGNIRFKSVGYSGNEDKAVQKISLMIEMVK